MTLVLIDFASCWGGSSAGRASRSQCEGREFDPPPLHQLFTKTLSRKAFFFSAACRYRSGPTKWPNSSIRMRPFASYLKRSRHGIWYYRWVVPASVRLRHPLQKRESPPADAPRPTIRPLPGKSGGRLAGAVKACTSMRAYCHAPRIRGRIRLPGEVVRFAASNYPPARRNAPVCPVLSSCRSTVKIAAAW